MLRNGQLPEAVDLYRRAISAGPSPQDFRARVGLLRCAVKSSEAAAQDPVPKELSERVAASLWDLLDHHEEELLSGSCLDAVQGSEQSLRTIAMEVAHAELLVDAWLSESDGEEKDVLRMYATGSVAEALQAALKWYQRAAANDIGSLIESYMAPNRYVTDRPGTVPEDSLFASVPSLRCDLDDAPGPARPRAMLRRLIAALGPRHKLVSDARADLTFLLDRKPHVPFFTRNTFKLKGGGPERGRGTGSGSGYSKPYWIYWGPGRDTRNPKKMGGPHSVMLE